MKIKPIQLVVLVLGVIAVVGVLAWEFSGSSGVTLSHRMLLVDVTTGELFETSTAKRAIMEPAPNPDTGVLALVRVEKDNERGGWFVGHRVMPYLDKLGVEPKAIDAESGKVLTPSGKIRSYTIK